MQEVLVSHLGGLSLPRKSVTVLTDHPDMTLAVYCGRKTTTQQQQSFSSCLSFQDKMLFCDQCDRGYHTFCVGLKSLPTGKWECVSCRGDSVPVKPLPKPSVRGK